MRRTFWLLSATLGLGVLVAPAPAGADTFDEYQRLVKRRLNPPPLVPTSVPRSLTPIDSTIRSGTSRRRSGYGLTIVRQRDDGTATAIIVLDGGSLPTVDAARREARRGGYSSRSIRVRGRRGYLFRRKLGGITNVNLTWSEGGRVYSMATRTLRTVSINQLRATAADLEPLGRDYIGSDASGEQSGLFVTTETTVSGGLEWAAQCTTPEGLPRSSRAAGARVALLRLRGNAFSFDIGPNLVQRTTDPWTGTVSGTVTPDAMTINFQATGVVDGTNCDTGPVSMTLDKRSQF